MMTVFLLFAEAQTVRHHRLTIHTYRVRDADTKYSVCVCVCVFVLSVFPHSEANCKGSANGVHPLVPSSHPSQASFAVISLTTSHHHLSDTAKYIHAFSWVQSTLWMCIVCAIANIPSARRGGTHTQKVWVLWPRACVVAWWWWWWFYI